jgi:hypothetical protein
VGLRRSRLRRSHPCLPARRKRYAHAASKQTPTANKQTPAANKQTPAANKHSIGSDTCTVARLQRSPEYLSLYIDAKMRAGLKGSSEEEVERTLDKVHPDAPRCNMLHVSAKVLHANMLHRTTCWLGTCCIPEEHAHITTCCKTAQHVAQPAE